ncbi:carbohydrate ABC transporter membrane protein 2 (CUT1 family) [Roseiarcus fermentans]|uniref:Carbohydrate ABC transporter membrane protein 2 (CUT1 family) n=1 Tax=Roseiarcus fermentans TaxID=1473586 RepID=A0A366FTW2_9HYPH|nr:carbohydrate ABC transporter permease [Roseiarcus fermentans]RBP18123.1 carbohydrate ABC transporter membrane protein 2 (CUT1 family) [Roseiarcus fermentans]
MTESKRVIVSPKSAPVENNWWVHMILVTVFMIAVIPVLWVVMTAFMTKTQTQVMPPEIFFKPSFNAFGVIVRQFGMLTFMAHSIIIAVASTFFSVTIGTFCAYALARFSFPGKEDVSFWILTNRMMPAVAVILPIFMIFQTFGLLDTFVGIIFLYTAMQLPFVVWMLKGYFEDIPREFEEVALVDGDTWLGAFRKVVLPLMRPSITAASIFVLILSWNEYAFALFLTGTNTRTLPPSVVTFTVSTEVSFDLLGAAAVIIAGPILLFVVFVQKQFVRGLSMGMVR